MQFQCLIHYNTLPKNYQIGTGYGIKGITVDGNDPIAVYAAMKEARIRALNGDGPTLIEAVTARMTPHSSDDDDHRSKSIKEGLKANDCNVKFKSYLLTLALLIKHG